MRFHTFFVSITSLGVRGALLPDSPSACKQYEGQNYTISNKSTPLWIRIGKPPEIQIGCYRVDSRWTASLGLITRFMLTDCQGRHQRGGQWCPVPQLNSVHPLSCLVPRLMHSFNIIFKKCGPSLWFWPPCCKTLAMGLLIAPFRGLRH